MASLPNLLAFNVGVEIGQLLALGAILITMGFWRRTAGFFQHAYTANVAMMCAGFMLIGYQLHRPVRILRFLESSTMYNADLPNRADLPTTGKLLRSTALAALIAGGLLVTNRTARRVRHRPHRDRPRPRSHADGRDRRSRSRPRPAPKSALPRKRRPHSP